MYVVAILKIGFANLSFNDSRSLGLESIITNFSFPLHHKILKFCPKTVISQCVFLSCGETSPRKAPLQVSTKKKKRKLQENKKKKH